jgi:hypothetical protein
MRVRVRVKVTVRVTVRVRTQGAEGEKPMMTCHVRVKLVYYSN